LTCPSVVGLTAVFGAGGGTSSYQEIEHTDAIVLWGSNARETHPIFFHHVCAAFATARSYTSSILVKRRALAGPTAGLGIDVGSDIALANAVGREILAAGLENREFVTRATDGFEAYRVAVEPYTLEYAEKTNRRSGVPYSRTPLWPMRARRRPSSVGP